jgi:hypothetical protein
VLEVKPVPVRLIVVAGEPALNEFGVTEVSAGVAGGGAGALTVRLAADETPPPGAGFMAFRDKVPLTETSAVVRATLAFVELTKVVGRAFPFTSITVAGSNPVPATVTTGELVPVVSIAGEIEEIVGDGLLTVSSTAVPGPLLTVPFMIITANCAPLASWVAGTTAVSPVALT